MSKGHFESAGGHIEYGSASVLFPVAEAEVNVFQYRDAELALAEVDSDDAIVITPTSVATSYALTQHPLTVISVDSLPSTVRAELNGGLDEPIETFELIQVGKWNTDSPNRSLMEFTAD